MLYVLVSTAGNRHLRAPVPQIDCICHSFPMTDDYWDSQAPLAINQTAGQEKRRAER